MKPTDDLTVVENASIAEFMKQAGSEGYLSGRVLDYGCGRSPYRKLIEGSGGIYFGFDRQDFSTNQFGDVGSWDLETEGPLEEDWDTIVCNQVIQYVPVFFRDDDEGLPYLLQSFRLALRGGGHLVMTYPTNWPEVQDADLWRFTKAGMERLLKEAGFTIVTHRRREIFSARQWEFALGYGVVAKA